MSINELEQKVAEIRAKPLQLVCVTRKGEKRVMSTRECWETEAKFLHIAADDLDKLLQYYKAGETVEMVCCSRNSGYEYRTLTITLQEITAEQSQPWEGSDPRGYGIPGGSIWGNGGGWY